MSAAENKAVFLSYASQDAEAARRICDALRAAGVEVWFDQSELRGGDAWDQKIRRQIKECALFMPIISANTNARAEGYFRLEWLLAVERSRLMADDAPFLVPVVIDDMNDAAARVPERFRDRQWTRIRAGETSSQFCDRVKALLAGDTGVSPVTTARGVHGPPAAHPSSPRVGLPRRGRPAMIAVAILVAAAAAIAVWQPWRSSKKSPSVAAAAVALAKPLSAARQLAEKARTMSVDKYDSTADDFGAAETLVKSALELDPNDGEIWGISSTLNKQFQTRGFDKSPQRMANARSHAERAIKLAPDSIEALFALGYWQRDTDPAAAEQTFEKVLSRAPGHAPTLLGLANLYRRQERIDEAVALLRRVAAQPANAALAGYIEFLTFFYRGRFAEAERAVRTSIAVQPSANSQGGLAMLLLTWKGAADEAARVLASGPASVRNEPRTVWITAQVQLCRRAPDEALKALDRLADDFIQDSWFIGPKAYFAGRAHALAGRAEAARVAWEAGLAVVRARLKDAPENRDLHLACGELLAWLGQRDEALRAARTVAELDRGRLTDWSVSPVRIYAALGRTDDALPLLEKLSARTVRQNIEWPLTPALLRLDPLWDKLRDDARFAKLCAEPDQPTAADGQKTVGAPAREQKSVAVLAFANLSDDKENEYFSDGISEELLNVLAKVPGLRVAARTSAFYFKNQKATAQEIGQKLGVAHLVEGSVRRAGSRVRIAARLSKAETGEQLWSESYEDELKDVFALQDKIARLIAQALQLKLSIASAATTAAVNPQAFELYLQARHAWTTRTREGFARAEDLLNQALAIDRGFARAHAAIADVWTEREALFGTFGPFGQRESPAVTEIEAKISRALALDPNLSEARAALGNLRWRTWRLDDAVRELRASITLNPNYASAHHWLGRALLSDARIDEAILALGRAADLDPLSPRILDNYAFTLHLKGRFAEALALNQRALLLQPDSVQAAFHQARDLSALGRHDEAVALVRQLPTGERFYARYTVDVLMRAGLKAEAEQVLASMPARGERYLALASLDRPVEALAAMEPSTLDVHNFYEVLINPAFDPIRRDPRFITLLTTLGMTEAHARGQAWHAAQKKPTTARP